MTKEVQKIIKDNQHQPEVLLALVSEFQKSKYIDINELIQEAIKEPILVTEDGCQLYSDTSIVFYVDPEDDWRCSQTEYRNYFEENPGKYFSTPESRQSYITLNKPLTSVKEQVEAIANLKSNDEYKTVNAQQLARIEDCLTALAQSKLK